MQAHAAGAGLPDARRGVPAQSGQLVPRLAAVGRAEERRVLDARVDRVRVVQRGLDVPHARELPRMLRAVVPLVCARHAVVRELVADGLPVLPAVVRALHDLAVPARGLGCVHPVRVGRRPLQVVDLPARKQRALDVPVIARPVRGQDERAFLGPHEEPHLAHRFPPCRISRSHSSWSVEPRDGAKRTRRYAHFSAWRGVRAV